MTANFPDDFKTVRIFQMIANFPDDSKTVPGFFQLTADFLDDFKSVWIFPDADGIPPMLLILFRGEGVPKMSYKAGVGGPRTFLAHSLAMSREANVRFLGLS